MFRTFGTSFYARRVYILSQSIICPVLIVGFSSIGTAVGLLFIIKKIVVKKFTGFHSLAWLPVAGSCAGVLADLLVAGAMCWSLYHKRTGFARTDTILTTLMAYTINSGFLSSLLGVASMICFELRPSSLIGVAIFWTMSKFFVNSLLAMLNSRDYVRGRSTVDGTSDAAYNSISIRFDPSNEVHSSQRGVSITVHP